METKEKEKCEHQFTHLDEVRMESDGEVGVYICCDKCDACFSGQCFLEPTEK